MGTERWTMAAWEEEGLSNSCWAGRKPVSPEVIRNELGTSFHGHWRGGFMLG